MLEYTFADFLSGFTDVMQTTRTGDTVDNIFTATVGEMFQYASDIVDGK